jgi:NADP-dependent 3-hydroxy acid dehydrogenase YdfG
METADVAIVAGVGPGTGAALARAFAREGYAIGLLSRHAESSEPVATEIHSKGGKALFVPTDVTSRQNVNDAIAKIRSQLGPITALVHNASGYGRASFWQWIPSKCANLSRRTSWAQFTYRKRSFPTCSKPAMASFP